MSKERKAHDRVNVRHTLNEMLGDPKTTKDQAAAIHAALRAFDRLAEMVEEKHALWMRLEAVLGGPDDRE